MEGIPDQATWLAGWPASLQSIRLRDHVSRCVLQHISFNQTIITMQAVFCTPPNEPFHWSMLQKVPGYAFATKKVIVFAFSRIVYNEKNKGFQYKNNDYILEQALENIA